VKIGNDGKPYFEARNVRIEDNLLIGNSSDEVHAPLGVSGAKASASSTTPWSEICRAAHTRSMSISRARTAGTRTSSSRTTSGPTRRERWTSSRRRSAEHGPPVARPEPLLNGGDPIPRGELLSPIDDARRVVRDPRSRGSERRDPAHLGRGLLRQRQPVDPRRVHTPGRDLRRDPADSPAVGRASGRSHPTGTSSATRGTVTPTSGRSRPDVLERSPMEPRLSHGA